MWWNKHFTFFQIKHVEENGLFLYFSPLFIYYIRNYIVHVHSSKLINEHLIFCDISVSLLLAHLSRRLMSELIVYQWLRHQLSIRPSTFSNIFSSKTTGPIELKFHMETPWDGRTKVCSNLPVHMTKMAAMPIYGKNHLKIYFPRWP